MAPSLLRQDAGHCISCHAFITQYIPPPDFIQLLSQRVAFRPRPLNTNDVDVNVPCRDIFIEEIKPDDTAQLELMSKFCIDMFFGVDYGMDNDMGIGRSWRNVKLAAMQKAQMIDLTMPTSGNRSIFVAKTQSSEIIGCCEVIEERIDFRRLDSEIKTRNKQIGKKSNRLRPIIENLTVQPKYRRQGIGLDLVAACESAVQTWIPRHDEVYSQVEEENTSALKLFKQCGYTSLFVDPTCTKTSLDGTLFAKSTTVSKVMLRKFLVNEADLELF